MTSLMTWLRAGGIALLLAFGAVAVQPANAQDAAISSSNQADKATTKGGVKEARKAKREAKKSYREAKDARSANKDIGDQDDKIASLKGQLAKKQERLDQLTAMRTAIGVQYPQQ